MGFLSIYIYMNIRAAPMLHPPPFLGHNVRIIPSSTYNRDRNAVDCERSNVTFITLMVLSYPSSWTLLLLYLSCFFGPKSTRGGGDIAARIKDDIQIYTVAETIRKQLQQAQLVTRNINRTTLQGRFICPMF